MSKIARFEDLIARQKAKKVDQADYLLSWNGEFARVFGLCDQIQRASVLIMSNIVEDFER